MCVCKRERERERVSSEQEREDSGSQMHWGETVLVVAEAAPLAGSQVSTAAVGWHPQALRGLAGLPFAPSPMSPSRQAWGP